MARQSGTRTWKEKATGIVTGIATGIKGVGKWDVSCGMWDLCAGTGIRTGTGTGLACFLIANCQAGTLLVTFVSYRIVSFIPS